MIARALGRLDGRRIIITGAASGIGLATADLFIREGAQVALFDRDKDRLSEVSIGFERSTPFGVDVSAEAPVRDAVGQAADAMGGIDGIVNAAGIMRVGSLRHLSLDDWNRMIAVNLTGAFLIIKTALPFLEANASSTIVNVVSESALYPYKHISAYVASKGGLLAFGRALAADLGPKVRVNSVAPGATDTAMARDVFRDPKVLADAGQNYALAKIGLPSEIAQAILFLTGPESSHITGTTLAVDGGRSFH